MLQSVVIGFAARGDWLVPKDAGRYYLYAPTYVHWVNCSSCADNQQC